MLMCRTVLDTLLVNSGYLSTKQAEWLTLLFSISVAFQMYDLDSDDKISRDELLAVLHMMVGDNISEEQVR